MRLLLRLVAFGLVVSALGCASSPIRDPSTLSYFHSRVATDDGWQLGLFRIAPAEAANDRSHFGTPVVLAHGTAVNRENFLLPERALALYLAEEGFDVWLFELRGDRSSAAPDRKTWRRGQWTIDDFAHHDVPALLTAVLRETGQDQVYWVGHSLGGILGYITLQGPLRDHVAGLVTLGSPGGFAHPNRLARRAGPLMGIVGKRGHISSRGLGKLLAPFISLAPDSYLLHAIFNLEHVHYEDLVGFVGSALENMGTAAVHQYRGWVKSGRLLSADGTVDYSAGLSDVRAPTLVVAGRIDHIVPPWWVFAAYERLGSSDKTFVVLGEGWGTRADYGHGDFVLSDWATNELYPMISTWISDRQSGDLRRDPQLQAAGTRELDPLLDASDLDAVPAAEAEGEAPAPGEATASEGPPGAEDP